MVVFGACFTSLSNYIIVKYVKEHINFVGIFGIGSGFTAFAVLLILCFNEKLDSARLEKMGHIVYSNQKQVNSKPKEVNTEESGFEGGEKLILTNEDYVDMRDHKTYNGVQNLASAILIR